MTKVRARYLLVFMVLFFLFPTIALADTVQGTVAKVSRNSLELTVFDSQGKPYPNALRLKIDNRTRLNGFSSVSSIRKQDAVRADVSQERSGSWHMDSISKLQGTLNVQQASAPPSASLMDALKSPTGQKVIRNGLTGALTGAVASGASGGKAGKGALIGAGVGIVGGFLADLLGQRPQAQTASSTVTSQEETRR